MKTRSLAAVTEPQSGERQRTDIKYLIRAMVKYNASDLHLKIGRPPLYRINGKIIPAKMREMTAEEVDATVFSVLSPKLIAKLEEKRQVDLSFHIQDLGRYRCNVYYQRGALSAAIRAIPISTSTMDELGIPAILKKLCQTPRGLLLITGATNSGKSTTLASVIQYLNDLSHVHILTIEDPIEYVFRDSKASITQREVGSDVQSLQEGIHAGLRQDPDVIVIGEIRDCENIQAALTAAETGHLVLATLHTNDAKSSIDRIIDVIPPQAKNQVRIQLASSLVGVVSQQLLPRADGHGRVLACEVMVKSPAIEGYILRDELDRIPEAIATSRNYYGMESMNQALERLVNSGAVNAEQALKVSNTPDDLQMLLNGVARESGYELAGGNSSQKVTR